MEDPARHVQEPPRFQQAPVILEEDLDAARQYVEELVGVSMYME